MNKESLQLKSINRGCHKYNCSKKNIQRKIDEVIVIIPKKTPRKIVVLMDTTYFGRVFGVMLFKDAYTKENLLKHYEKQRLIIFTEKELQN